MYACGNLGLCVYVRISHKNSHQISINLLCRPLRRISQWPTTSSPAASNVRRPTSNVSHRRSLHPTSYRRYLYVLHLTSAISNVQRLTFNGRRKEIPINHLSKGSLCNHKIEVHKNFKHTQLETERSQYIYFLLKYEIFTENIYVMVASTTCCYR